MDRFIGLKFQRTVTKNGSLKSNMDRFIAASGTDIEKTGIIFKIQYGQIYRKRLLNNSKGE